MNRDIEEELIDSHDMRGIVSRLGRRVGWARLAFYAPVAVLRAIFDTLWLLVEQLCWEIGLRGAILKGYSFIIRWAPRFRSTLLSREGYLLARSRRFAEAFEVWAEASADQPDNAALQLCCGDMLYELGRFMEAAERYRRSVLLAKFRDTKHDAERKLAYAEKKLTASREG